VFANPDDCDKAVSKLKVLKQETRGSLYTLTVRGIREEALAAFDGISMTFVETLGLSLEEIFISETEVVGYDIKKLILG
jgi:ABC-2 type transport system ATP-binding protein